MTVDCELDVSNKHSGFSSTFPIYLYRQYEDEVPVEDEEQSSPEDDRQDKKVDNDDDDEAVIEEVSDDEPKAEEKEKKTVKVLKEEWMHLNPLPPVWIR